MKIGFKPEINKEYKCFRQINDSIIESFKFPDQCYYLLPTESNLRGKTVHYKINIDSDVETKINDAINTQIAYFRQVNGIVMNNWNLLRLSAKLSHQMKFDCIKIVDTYNGIPITMNPLLPRHLILATSEVDYCNIIVKR